jgi:hypothetical protein
MFSRVSLVLILSSAACNRSNLPGKDAGVDGGVVDTGPRDGGDVTTMCPNPPIDVAASGETCAFTPGGSDLLIRGDIVVPEGLLENGHLLIGIDGRVACAACDCSGSPGFSGATVVACADAIVSPGLINAHEHLTFGEGAPINHDPERFEHRHDWREGQNGHTNLPTPRASQGPEAVTYAELRHVLGGATSVNGSGGAPGLLRNLDRSGADQGLDQANVRYATFPLGDAGGERRTSDCSYPGLDAPDDPEIANAIAYTPHIAEGIGADARNEFTCLSGEGMGSTDVVISKTAIIHGVALTASDYATMAADGTSLIWSARTNIDLYGHTAPVTLAANTGVLIALGTDWPASGSMNVLRELACFVEYNDRNLGGYFTDRELVDMATINAATALKSESKIGALAAGRIADVAVFDGSAGEGYRAILGGEPKTTALVLRAGVALYGDAELVAGLTDGNSGCEVLDVCGVSKRVCLQRESGQNLSAIQAAISPNTLPLFQCGVPAGEPTCIPFRMGEFDGQSRPDDRDGDGVSDAQDNCPSIFNAPRDVDQGQQPDADGDMMGDACDPCPLDANSGSCSAPDPNDRDGDGLPNAADNCPSVANADQADRDVDQIGDACDACPDQPNPNGGACSVSVYDIKQGNVTGRVRLDDITVTGSGPNGYFVQRAPGDAGYDASLRERFSGIFVFAGADVKPAQGDRVDVEGDVSNFFGQLQLEAAMFTVRTSGNPLPPPVTVTAAEVATGGSRAAELEGVLVAAGAVTVTGVAPMPGPGDRAPTNEFEVEGILRVNDYFYLAAPFPAVNDAIANLQGVLRFANGNSKVEPRGPEDLGIPPRLAGFEPSTAYAPEGISNMEPPTGFAVRISRPATEVVTVMLTSMNAGITVPAAVTIAVGTDRAPVPVTAPAPAMGAISATYAGVTVMGQVVIYDDASPRRVVDVSLDDTMVATNATVRGVVRLDLPGAAGGTRVDLAVVPAGLGSVPAMITVPQGSLELGFDLTTTAMTGTATLTASAPGGGSSVTFSVLSSVDRPPVPGDLVITEVHRNPTVATNEYTHEWFEVFNASTDGISIDGLEIEDNNDLHVVAAPGVSIPPGGYAVFAYSAVPAENGGVTAIAAYGVSNLQLANGDDELHLRYMGMEIDVIDWASTWPGGSGVSMCLRTPYPPDNNVQAAWADSVGAFGTGGDAGSPGVASDATNCP